LIILGARQIGKTYSILEFGNKNYKNAAYFYFEGNLKLQNLFVNANDNIQNLIIQLSIYSGINIIPETTLIIFDEIQSCNAAISSLKRIYEVMPNLHIICAGSLLGLVTKREGFSFPVGKVDILKMHPMNFYEFVLAIDNNNTTLLNEIQKCYDNNKKFSNHDKAIDLYNLYLVIGGMPDVVETYIKTKNLLLVKAKQMNILESYSKDMVKYCTTSESIKIESCFNSIPAQLAKENHKFQYNIIKSGARAKEYENCIDWLVSSNIVLKSIKIKQPIMPIKMYEDLLSYKIYMLDVGLFCAKCDFVQQTILFNNDNNISKGTLTETYVAEELNSGNISLHY
jgi:predicted AAA+ superfamily ATPase